MYSKTMQPRNLGAYLRVQWEGDVQAKLLVRKVPGHSLKLEHTMATSKKGAVSIFCHFFIKERIFSNPLSDLIRSCYQCRLQRESEVNVPLGIDIQRNPIEPKPISELCASYSFCQKSLIKIA